MNLSRQSALFQCETANATGGPYKPAAAWLTATNYHVLEGNMSRGNLGGFYLTAQGIREIARLRREKMLATL